MATVILLGMGLLGACIGAALSWRRGTEAMGHSIDVASAPQGMRGRVYRRDVRRQRRRRRLLTTALAALVGGALGVGAAFGAALLEAVR